MAVVTTIPRPANGRWTFEDVWALPDDGFRHEIVDGNLVVAPAPNPLHQVVAGRLARALQPQLPQGLEVIEATNVVFEDGDLRIPDLLVAPTAVLIDPARRFVTPSDLTLAVEIVSPSSRKTDRFAKPREYAEAGIPAYWRIEAEAQLTLVVYRLVGSNYEISLTTHGGLADPDVPFPVRIDLDTLGA